MDVLLRCLPADSEQLCRAREWRKPPSEDPMSDRVFYLIVICAFGATILGFTALASVP
jgi:hypothetical protein